MDPKDDIFNFLKVFRALECVSCNSVLAFQHRVTGALYCATQNGEGGQNSRHASCYMQALQPRPAQSSTDALGVGLPNVNVLQPGELRSPQAANSRTASESETIVEQSQSRTVDGDTSSPSRGLVVAPASKYVVSTMSDKTRTPDAGLSKSSESQTQQVQVPKTAPVLPMAKVKPEGVASSCQANTKIDSTVVSKSDPNKCYFWSDCTYSTNLAQNAVVNILFSWSMSSYLVVAKRDEGNLQCMRPLVIDAADGEPLKAPPAVGCMVVARHKSEYRRGRVTDVTEENLCTVELVDYGGQTLCKYSKLFPVNAAIMANPIYGLTVQLKDLPPIPKGIKLTSAQDEMVYKCSYHLEFGRRKQIIAPSEDTIEVRLIDARDTGLSLSDKLQIALFPAGVPMPKVADEEDVASSDTVPAVHKWDQCKYSPNLASSSVVYVAHHYSPVMYHINADADTDALAKFQDLLSQYIKKAKPLTRPPIRDQIVIGNYGGQYYRGRVENAEGDKCTVLFVDYGDKAVCKFSEVFPVDETIMKYPVFGMMVGLNKVPDPPSGFKLNPELASMLNESLILDLLKQKVATPEEGCYIIQAHLWDADQECVINSAVSKAIRSFTG